MLKSFLFSQRCYLATKPHGVIQCKAVVFISVRQ
jgi:hypothetical protein